MIRRSILAGLAAVALSTSARAEVLGPCGTQDAMTPGAAAAAPAAGAVAAAPALAISPLPLPGQQAPNFELQAVVGEEVKTIKLSDYDWKWRVICFYPADFTFV
jgi:hypothetical protein